MSPRSPVGASRSPVHRRAVLAERLLLDLGDADTIEDAGAVVTQAMVTVGGASWARIERRDPRYTFDAPAIVVASTGIEEDGPRMHLSDRDGGLSITLDDAEVPPIAITRALHALAVVIRRIERQDTLLREARTDSLTGLLNRRALDERLEAELARQQRGGHPLSLLLVDVDDFKQVNDRFGHAHGDAALRQVAAAMGEVARAADDLGRIGGDEFALLLPDTDEDGALAAANRLCERVRVLDAGVTVSVGAATSRHAQRPTATTLLGAADEALYAAKAAGRDGAAITHAGGRDMAAAGRSDTAPGA